MGEDEDGEDDDDGPDPEEEWKGLADKELCPESERITIESFAAWKLKFDEEMVECGVLKREGVKSKSGKSIFMEAPKEGEAAGEDGKPGVAGAYNAALFGEEDDLDDLDDL